jgi:hypothetical protein
MNGLLPEYSGASELRQKASVALMTDAEAAVEAGDCERAISLFESIQRAWPGAPGVDDRVAWCRERLLAEQRQQEFLEGVLAAGEGGNPEDGLRRLDAETPGPGWEERYDEARRRLEQQLADLDAGYPVVELPQDFELAFRKNQLLVVPLRVSDDYRVEKVVVLVSVTAGPGYREIELHHAGDDLYPFEVTPDLHGNSPVNFYVVATDRAGHETRLGGPQGPLTIKRKKWFQK